MTSLELYRLRGGSTNPSYVYGEWYYELVEWDGIVLNNDCNTPTPTSTETATVTATPLATSTGVWSSYCGSVAGPIAPSTFWSGIMFGDSLCVDVGGWDLTIFGFTYHFPLLEFCLQGVSFGYASLLGVAINLDDILLLLVAVMTIFVVFLA